MSGCFVSVSLQIGAILSADRSPSRLSNCIMSAWGGPFWKHLIFCCGVFMQRDGNCFTRLGCFILVWFVFLMRALQLREGVPRSFMLTIRDNEYICYSLCYCLYLLTVRNSEYICYSLSLIVCTYLILETVSIFATLLLFVPT